MPRHRWSFLTAGEESAAVWVPPGERELTDEQEHELEALLRTLLWRRAGRHRVRRHRAARERPPPARAAPPAEPVRHARGPPRPWHRDGAPRCLLGAGRRRQLAGLSGVDEPGQRTALHEPGVRAVRAGGAGGRPGRDDDVAAGGLNQSGSRRKAAGGRSSGWAIHSRADASSPVLALTVARATS